jgi:hypothetical protein
MPRGCRAACVSQASSSLVVPTWRWKELLRLPSLDLATGCESSTNKQLSLSANAGVPACLQAPEASLMVSFPDDYPNSVRHFLMVGFMGFLIGAGIFFYFGYSFP